MRVKVLYFAAVQELAGTEEEDLELPGDAGTVEDFVRFIGRVRPRLADALTRVRIARNEAFAERGERIAEGDVLAIIPPVAGG